jgi:hypothetical protein
MSEGRKDAELSDERMEALRKEIDNLKRDPKFRDLSKAFRRTLAERTGAARLGGPGTSIKGVLPIPLAEILERADLTKSKNAEKLREVSVTLGAIAEAAGIDDISKLPSVDKLEVDPAKLELYVDPGDLVGPWYWNIYRYRFW